MDRNPSTLPFRIRPGKPRRHARPGVRKAFVDQVLRGCQ